jgi:hypothetical protein
VAAAAVLAVVLVVFQPQRLFLDTQVNETLPSIVVSPRAAAPATAAVTPSTASAAGAASTPTPPSTVPANRLDAAAAEAARLGAPVAISSDSFVSVDHPTTGTARLVVQPDGSRLVRFEGLDTDNGPDLRVVLSTSSVGSGTYADRVELAALKGNKGDQNYAVPAGVDLSRVQSVVIWCERFSVAFGEAPLTV